MNSKISSVLFFTLGGAAGSLVTYTIMKKKYQKDVNDVREAYARKIDEYEIKNKIYDPDAEILQTTDQRTQKELVEIAINKPDISELVSAKYGHVDYTAYSKKPDKPVMENVEEVFDDSETGPYVISPSEFGEDDSYDKVSLIYYACGTITDELGEIVGDIDGSIGPESLSHFGEYEDDSVFVRNEKLRIDYEILLDMRTHQDMLDRRR